jgi:hypothetical protein
MRRLLRWAFDDATAPVVAKHSWGRHLLDYLIAHIVASYAAFGLLFFIIVLVGSIVGGFSFHDSIPFITLGFCTFDVPKKDGSLPTDGC